MIIKKDLLNYGDFVKNQSGTMIIEEKDQNIYQTGILFILTFLPFIFRGFLPLTAYTTLLKERVIHGL